MGTSRPLFGSDLRIKGAELPATLNRSSPPSWTVPVSCGFAATASTFRMGAGPAMAVACARTNTLIAMQRAPGKDSAELIVVSMGNGPSALLCDRRQVVPQARQLRAAIIDLDWRLAAAWAETPPIASCRIPGDPKHGEAR